jgi:pimeloyl-ACP methyl ester carboxylesterase
MDPVVPPQDTAAYYEGVAKVMGGYDKTRDFYRLFTAPGMGHCSGGPGPNQFDALTALEQWVEKGVAPAQLLATHSTAGKVDRSRPLCRTRRWRVTPARAALTRRPVSRVSHRPRPRRGRQQRTAVNQATRREVLKMALAAPAMAMAHGSGLAAQAALFPGFESRKIQTSGATINVLHGGSGPPLLLIHGYPQTHVEWHTIAPRLAQKFTVVMTDLRGYGDSSKPPDGENHAGYSKRAMALDHIEVMKALGFERFAVVGHDRGARVTWRMCIEHPQAITKAAVIDIVPLPYSMVTREFATGYYHWFFLIQPSPLPETLIGNSAEFYLRRDSSLESTLRRKQSPNTCACSRQRRFTRRVRIIARARASTSPTRTRRRTAGSRARCSCCGASKALSAASTT